MAEYSNPILTADYSDPDVIRVGKDFYMVSSSFNYFPGVPVMHSKNLINWELINYVITDPLEGYKKVRSGEGAWAPSIRYYKGIFYCMIPFPDEGIFVSTTTNPYGKWSKPRCLYKGRGFEDPCPIWIGDKTYVVFAFVKSRIGFNSKLGLLETDQTLSKVLSDKYTIIYDGTKDDQVIEGPKVYLIDQWIYILAPAGGVEHGYQVGLKAKTINGPFQRKILLKEGDNGINGPHQGALVDIDNNGNYAFIHFEDQKGLGRVTMLEPAFIDREGNIELGINSLPVKSGIVSMNEDGNNIEYSDMFNSKSLSLIWQAPAVIQGGWLTPSENGLKMNNTLFYSSNLTIFPCWLCQKISSYHQTAILEVSLFLDEGDEFLFGIIGSNYLLSGVKKINGRIFKIVKTSDKEEVLGEIFEYERILLSAKYDYPNCCSCSELKEPVQVAKEHWTGLHYCVGLISTNPFSKGYAVLNKFSVSD